MAFTRAPATSLALYGGPGQPVAPVTEAQTVTDTVSVSLTDVSSLVQAVALTVTDTVSVSITDASSLVTAEASAYATELGLYGGPRPHQQYAAATAVSTFALDVSDTLAVQWLEEPVDSNEIISGETLRVGLAEVSALFNFVQASDTVQVQLSETISLLQSGVTLKTASDTLSVTLTETSSVGVSLAVSDTASVSVADTSGLVTPSVSVDVTDTLSVSLTEGTPLLGVFSGVLDITASDILVVSTVESGISNNYVPTAAIRPFRIRIVPRTARIRIVSQ